MTASVHDDKDAADRVIRLFARLPALVSADADLTRRARFLTCDFKLGIGSQELIVSLVEGAVRAVDRGPFLLRPCAFSLSAAAGIWSQLLEPVPKAGVHDIMALSKQGLLRIEGNLQPFMANLQVIKDIVTKPRQIAD